MREILFRGKTPEGKWVEGFYYVATSGYAGSDEVIGKPLHMITTGRWEASGAYGERNELVEHTVIPESIGQYTGLTDKNGKRIFEGDIIKATCLPKTKKDYILGTVVFENGTFKLSVFGNVTNGEFSFIYSSYDDDKKTSKYAIENNFIFRGYYLEVIGNIHDNPKLLEAE